MTEPQRDQEGREVPPATVDPTLRVARPPIPGRAIRAEMAAGNVATPPVHHDEPTVTIAGPVRPDPRRTLEFGTPVPVKVTVGPRPRRPRRFRTWPWIVAVALALVVLGAVLLVLMWRGAIIDGNTELSGSGRSPAPGIAVSFPVGSGH